MKVSLQDAAHVQVNMTPILDMVFQLITFFMLVINFKNASMERSLNLPVVGSARPVDTKGLDEVLVLNIDADGKLVVYGQARDVESYIAQEAFASLLSARRVRPDLKAGEELPTTVVIRADQDTPFRLLNHVIRTCQVHGYRQFSFKAVTKKE
jgi:biopolymer transport protein ExbD